MSSGEPPSTGGPTKIVLSDHLKSPEMREIKIAILNSLSGTYIPHAPSPYTADELLRLGRIILMDRFMFNNRQLRLLCESEAAIFDNLAKIWQLPESEREKASPTWAKDRHNLLLAHLFQVAYYEEQQIIKRLLEEQCGVSVTMTID